MAPTSVDAGSGFPQNSACVGPKFKRIVAEHPSSRVRDTPESQGREGESAMKKLIQAARSAFGVRTRPAPPASDESKRRETDKRIVSDLSSGNVRLQQGQFTTREDIDRERERVLARKL